MLEAENPLIGLISNWIKNYYLIFVAIFYIFIGSIFGEYQYKHHHNWTVERTGNSVVEGIVWPIFIVIEAGKNVGDRLF